MFDCIIFDLDGTLVDSEPLCNQAFLDILPELPLSLEEMLIKFRGRKLSEIVKEIELLSRQPLPEDFVPTYRAQVEKNFKTSLQAFPGVREALCSLEIPICIASSGPASKITSALEKTGLDDLFQDRIYSSYDVGKWKPDPGLFLYAAAKMEVSCDACLVVEDSQVGIVAAQAAGMVPLQFSRDGAADDDVECFDDYRVFIDRLSDMSKLAGV